MNIHPLIPPLTEQLDLPHRVQAGHFSSWITVASFNDLDDALDAALELSDGGLGPVTRVVRPCRAGLLIEEDFS